MNKVYWVFGRVKNFPKLDIIAPFAAIVTLLVLCETVKAVAHGRLYTRSSALSQRKRCEPGSLYSEV